MTTSEEAMLEAECGHRQPWRFATYARQTEQASVSSRSRTDGLLFVESPKSSAGANPNIAFAAPAWRARLPRSAIELARPRRFELLTYGFGDRRSIQLSYGRPTAPVLSRVRTKHNHGQAASPGCRGTGGGGRSRSMMQALRTHSASCYGGNRAGRVAGPFGVWFNSARVPEPQAPGATPR